MPPSLQQQQDRQAQHRLAVLRHAEEVTGNVALTCRYYGISRPCFYKWLHRYQDEGLEGLRDRSSKPHHCPHATEADVVNKIVYLRQHYHFGPMKIKMYLKRYHDIDIACSAVYRILKKLGMNRLPASQRYTRHDKRYTRYEKQQPGNRVQIDVKFIEPIVLPKHTPAAVPVTATLPKRRRRAKYYQFTAIDDCTRLRVLRIYPRCDQKTAVQFLDYVLERLPFRVEVIQTDNGAEFQSAFHWNVLDKGIAHTYIKPASPHLNGKVERSHRIDAEEFYRMLDGVVIDDTGVFNDKLREWEDYYNYHRPHGSLGGQTPYERLKQKAQTPV
ncbi:IS481 family transposase [Streptomyces roseus]|uniref:Transposase n=1 Tax=Streptomyces roseus TaxID=66430 RepID=A0A0J6XGJ7_9ACTN|nr:IS481 family transposase [Streptomyces roseus]KMO93788.1 transposase [Streptomyces roseus]